MKKPHRSAGLLSRALASGLNGQGCGGPPGAADQPFSTVSHTAAVVLVPHSTHSECSTGGAPGTPSVVIFVSTTVRLSSRSRADEMSMPSRSPSGSITRAPPAGTLGASGENVAVAPEPPLRLTTASEGTSRTDITLL